MTHQTDVRLFILTCDKYNWIIPATLHQIQHYWNPPPRILIAGYERPDLGSTTLDIEFYSIGNFADYPVERWSDALIKLLNDQTDEHIVLFLEDYLLTRQVDTRGLALLTQYAQYRNSVARVDLCTDRFYSTNAVEIGHVGHLDLFNSPADPSTDYRFSTQPSIWNVSHLISLLTYGESPWQTEVNGTNRLNARPDLRVIGTRQAPIRHLIAINKGQLDLVGAWQFPPAHLSNQDRAQLIYAFPILKQKTENQNQ